MTEISQTRSFLFAGLEAKVRPLVTSRFVAGSGQFWGGFGQFAYVLRGACTGYANFTVRQSRVVSNLCLSPLRQQQFQVPAPRSWIFTGS